MAPEEKQILDDEKQSIDEEATSDTLSERNSESISEIDKPAASAAPIPNGGTEAWLQVLGSFFLWFNTWGLINAYGAFQTYYTVELLASSSPSEIAWIGSVQSYLLLFVGALTGPIFDAGYFRTLLLTGSFLVVLGLMMTSIALNYWQVLLAQAFCTGIGAGCLFVPSVALLSTYFTTKVTIAMGIAASGSGLGGIIYPVVLHTLESRIGFGWACRVLGFLALATLVVPLAVMKVRMLPSQRRKIFDVDAWKDPAYTLYVVGCLIAFLGIWTPFFYIELYALEENITSASVAFYLLTVIIAGSVFGRLGPNLLAAKIGMYNVLIPCALITGILGFCFIPIRSVGALSAVGVLYGFFSGALVSLSPTISVQLSTNRGVIGTRMGMAFATIGLGMLIGTPVSGNLLNQHGFNAAFAFSGTAAIVGALVLVVSRGFHAGWKPCVKA